MRNVVSQPQHHVCHDRSALELTAESVTFRPWRGRSAAGSPGPPCRPISARCAARASRRTGPGRWPAPGRASGRSSIDAIVANLLAGLPYLFGVRYSADARGFAILGAFLLVELIFDAVYGQTLGKRLLGIRVIRVDGDGLASLPWLLLRTVLLGRLVPAVVWDRDRRGLHDKASGTVVVVDPNKAAARRSRPSSASR